MTDAAPGHEPRSELFEIEDLATLEVLIDPLRLRVVNALIGSALTVKEIAAELGVATTRLYYHVNLLLNARLIEVVDTEKVGASIQRRFRSTAKEYSPADSLARLVVTDRRTADAVTSLVLEGARVDANALLAQLRVDANHPNAKGAVGRVSLSISPSRVEYWLSRLTEVVDEVEQEREQFDDAQLYGFSFVLAPLASPLRGGAQ
ncbi:MAG: helix-turn-helix domain-containing protein [Actinobacteria bacterium]|nr:helix-turn-helix domain-containing protein [Actinomycetota bacterium]